MPQGNGGNVTFYLLIGGLVLVMWWMSRKSKKQRAEASAFRDTLAPGQEVMTGSGLFGVIVAVDDDRITLASEDGTRTTWLRAAIAKLIETEVPEPDYDEEFGEVSQSRDVVPDSPASITDGSPAQSSDDVDDDEDRKSE